jgi:hypothetical protein
MPRCQYRAPDGSIQAATFAAPKQVSVLSAWLLEAKRKISTIPVTFYRKVPTVFPGWGADGEAEVTPSFITFKFRDPNGNKCTLVIERGYDAHGR